MVPALLRRTLSSRVYKMSFVGFFKRSAFVSRKQHSVQRQIDILKTLYGTKRMDIKLVFITMATFACMAFIPAAWSESKSNFSSIF